MFSNQYYLFTLLENSFALSIIEKKGIFLYAKNNPGKILKIINILKDEQKGLKYIKKIYKKNINKIEQNFKKEITEKIKENKFKHFNKINKKIEEMKLIEQNEIKNELNNINLILT